MGARALWVVVSVVATACTSAGGGDVASSSADAASSSADAASSDVGSVDGAMIDAASPPDGEGETYAPDAALGWPDGTNTGYKSAPGYPGSLIAWSGATIASGQTYSFLDFPGGVDVGAQTAAVTGVTFVGCRFHGANPGGKLVGLYGTDITFDHCTFEPDVQPPQNVAMAQSYQYGLAGNGGYYTHVGKLTVRHCDLWGFGNAIDVNPTTDPGSPQVYSDNYIHHAADVTNAVYHHDGIGAESGSSNGSYVTLDHNTIESLGNTNAVAYQATGPYSYFVLTNNLFGGFGYAVAILGGATHVTFTGNTFSTRLPAGFGPLYPDNFWTTTGSSWRGNRWRARAGDAWGNPAHDGWFWLPNTPGGTTDDTGYVSQTDFAL